MSSKYHSPSVPWMKSNSAETRRRPRPSQARSSAETALVKTETRSQTLSCSMEQPVGWDTLAR